MSEKYEDMTKCVDAKVWAKEFVDLITPDPTMIDESLMITWFANAIMAGYQQGYSIALQLTRDTE